MRTPADAHGPFRSPRVQDRGQKEPLKSFPTLAVHPSLLVSRIAVSGLLRWLQVTPAHALISAVLPTVPSDSLKTSKIRAEGLHRLTYIKRTSAFSQCGSGRVVFCLRRQRSHVRIVSGAPTDIGALIILARAADGRARSKSREEVHPKSFLTNAPAFGIVKAIRRRVRARHGGPNMVTASFTLATIDQSTV
jgi:hypothetical protein